MAAGLEKTKRRIVSISSTKKITKAMGMIASVKLLGAKRKVEQAGFAYDCSSSILSSLCHFLPPESPYFQKKEGKRFLICFGSGLGLCGAYNSEAYKEVISLLKEGDVICPIGKKMENRLGKLGHEIVSLGLNSPRALQKTASKLLDSFLNGEYAEIGVVATHYVNSLKFKPGYTRLLPLEYKKPPYEVVPLRADASGELEKRSALLSLLSCLNYLKEDSSLSEQNSRRNAMDEANDNADELLRKLQVEYNKARQGAITQEIVEVVSGSKGA